MKHIAIFLLLATVSVAAPAQAGGAYDAYWKTDTPSASFYDCVRTGDLDDMVVSYATESDTRYFDSPCQGTAELCYPYEPPSQVVDLVLFCYNNLDADRFTVWVQDNLAVTREEGAQATWRLTESLVNGGFNQVYYPIHRNWDYYLYDIIVGPANDVDAVLCDRVYSQFCDTRPAYTLAHHAPVVPDPIGAYPL